VELREFKEKTIEFVRRAFSSERLERWTIVREREVDWWGSPTEGSGKIPRPAR
jgi:hypothetical protein